MIRTFFSNNNYDNEQLVTLCSRLLKIVSLRGQKQTRNALDYANIKQIIVGVSGSDDPPSPNLDVCIFNSSSHVCLQEVSLSDFT